MIWAVAGSALLLGLAALWAERRRSKRRDLDRVGWVPWDLVLILAFIVGAAALALALYL